MAEQIVFKVPTTVTFSDTVTGANWYQSPDGTTWGVSPVDTTDISILTLDSNGRYIWDSLVANADYYHLVKFVSSNGVELSDTLFLPPRPLYIKNAISGMQITDVSSYMQGESIELILRVDDAGIAAIGDLTNVTIADEFDNEITTIVARRVGSIYVTSWTIPLNLRSYYNPSGAPESDTDYFILQDKWNLYGNIVSYRMLINKVIESPTDTNSVIQISFGEIADVNGLLLSSTSTVFATKLTPFYASPNDVRDVNRGLLDGYNDFTIARQIINYSKIVDRMMKPDVIYYQETYDHAVRNFVRLKAAATLLLSVAQLNEEEKALDTFRYRTSSARPKDLIDPIEEQAEKFSLFIYAGGKDTPYVARNFVKGLYDPNRPQLARANFDSSGWFPWLNSAFRSFSIVDDQGNNIEIRGERGISYGYVMNKYRNADNGDAGYLSGI